MMNLFGFVNLGIDPDPADIQGSLTEPDIITG